MLIRDIYFWKLKLLCNSEKPLSEKQLNKCEKRPNK